MLLFFPIFAKTPLVMKRLLIIGLLFMVACGGSTKSTDRLLAEVREADQGIRHQMAALTKAVTVEGRTELIDSLILTSEQVERIDTRNVIIVDSLLQGGLPKGLSTESYKTIWLVIDHAPLQIQQKHLPLIEQMAAQGFIAQSDYATLFDRIAMGQHKPQRYGSQAVQFGTNDKQHLYLWPVECVQKLDSLRTAVGMLPIDEYLLLLTEATGIEAQFDPAITVEEMELLRGKGQQ